MLQLLQTFCLMSRDRKRGRAGRDGAGAERRGAQGRGWDAGQCTADGTVAIASPLPASSQRAVSRLPAGPGPAGRGRPAHAASSCALAHALTDGTARHVLGASRVNRRGRWGSPTRAPRPATPSDPGRPARPEHLSNVQPGPDISGRARTFEFFCDCNISGYIH